ncbi:MAG: EF-P beta-lysylation protein EpmB [Pirellulales bacterium]
MSIVTAKNDRVLTSSGAAGESAWRQSMRRAIRDPIALCRRLQLPESFERRAVFASRLFPVFAPLEFVARMCLGDPYDPLLRQVLPLDDEMVETAEFTKDPVDDDAATLAPGLLRKYRSRALLVTTGSCAVHCRYCFRRHYPYHESPKSAETWRPAIKEIADDKAIDEVILSGGDPLTLVDVRLAELAEQLEQIDHLRRLRVHTRLPVMIPSRVNSELIAWLTATRMTPIVVIHANHARELDDDVARAVGRFIDAGIVVMNQSVLLRGVNDSTGELIALSRRLLDLRVMPYYLHQLDRVAGAAHFEVPIETGRRLVRSIRGQLPGYAVPRYVQEVAGEPSKRVLA